MSAGKNRGQSGWHTRDRLLVAREKLHRGQCAYHGKYNNGQLHIVTIDNLVEFVFDHREREHKRATIAYLIGRYANAQIIINEMSKCELVCHNCHMRKTLKQQDFLPILRADNGQLQLFHE